jgi:tRNA 2-selenouridine synthase
MYKEIDIKTFLKKYRDLPVLDVRTPEEFDKGHITDAINFPLFDTVERTVIGKIYKEKGRHAAILKGLEITGGKVGKFVTSGRMIAKNNRLLLHCWRGGLRSASLAWLFDISGITSYVLTGGYKAYRKLVLEYMEYPWNLIVIGGMTGSGKTDILLILKKMGFQVLDLEALAHHKGSAFGALGEKPQNSNEQFENDIFTFLSNCNPVWVEDESQNIGRNLIPTGFFNQILNSQLICIETDIQTRINRLVRDYAAFSPELLELCIKKISKRLGGLTTKTAIESLHKGDFRKVAELMLDYYDKTYTYSLRNRNASKVHTVSIRSGDLYSVVDEILNLVALLGLEQKKEDTE